MFFWGKEWNNRSVNTASKWLDHDVYSLEEHSKSIIKNYEDKRKWWAIYVGKIKPVGSFSANAFGVHDMIGNVCEWCKDSYYSYSNDISINPTHNNPNEKNGIRRGGSYWSPVLYANCSYREPYSKNATDIDTGFRVVWSGEK